MEIQKRVVNQEIHDPLSQTLSLLFHFHLLLYKPNLVYAFLFQPASVYGLLCMEKCVSFP